MTPRPLLHALAALLAGSLAAGTALADNLTLKASHQFPGGKGDVRDEMVQMIARDVNAANVGLDIKVFPGASLFKATEQWKAMLNGQLDMTSFPLDYASGRSPAFGATLMPGLVKKPRPRPAPERLAVHEGHQGSDRKGRRHVLADAWLAGAFGVARTSASASPTTSRD